MMPPGAPPSPQPSSAPPVTIDAVMQLLRDGPSRRFRIDIETDSTISGDESQERQDRNAFIEVTTKFVKEWGPIVQAQPAMSQLGGELLLFGVRGFRVGRSLEEVVEETVDKLDQIAAQPKPPPQPSPGEQVKLETAKVKGQAEIQKTQLEGQIAQMEAQAEQQRMAMEAEFEKQRMAMDQQSQQMDMILKLLEHKQSVQQHHMDAERSEREHRISTEQTERNHELSMEVAEHKAKEAKKPQQD